MEIDHEEARFVVAGIRLERPFSEPFLVDRHHMLAKTFRSRKVQIYIFVNRNEFDRYAKTVADGITFDVLERCETFEDAAKYRNLVRSALVIAPRNPSINALNVLLSPRPKRAQAWSRRILQKPDDLNIFDQIVQTFDYESCRLIGLKVVQEP